MTEHVDDGCELMTSHEQAELWLRHAEHAQSQEGMQTFYLAAIAHLLRSIDDKLTPPVESDHDDHETHYSALEESGNTEDPYDTYPFIRAMVFRSTDEVIDFLLNDHEEPR